MEESGSRSHCGRRLKRSLQKKADEEVARKKAEEKVAREIAEAVRIKAEADAARKKVEEAVGPLAERLRAAIEDVTSA